MADIGSTLREARMRARIDISEVEVGTKIRAKYLRALENEEWDLLPGPVYVKSFLKTYGDFLGLDSRLLVDEFKRRYERPSDQEFRAIASTSRERGRSSGPSRLGNALLSPRSLIVAALVVIVLAIIVIGSHNGGKNPTNGGNAITPATTPKHNHDGTGANGGGTTTTRTQTTKTQTTPIVAQNASLKLVPTTTVWICVENQAGKPLMTARDYTTGEAIPTFHARQLLMTLGNSGVTMTADGKPYTPTLPAGSAAIGLRVTPTGVRRLSPAPTCGQ
jgi:cytoskeletal protein RodZ